MSKPKLYFALGLALLVGIVILQNTTVVETKLLFMTIAMPRAALLATTLVLGIVIGLAGTLAFKRKRSRSNNP